MTSTIAAPRPNQPLQRASLSLLSLAQHVVMQCTAHLLCRHSAGDFEREHDHWTKQSIRALQQDAAARLTGRQQGPSGARARLKPARSGTPMRRWYSRVMPKGSPYTCRTNQHLTPEQALSGAVSCAR